MELVAYTAQSMQRPRKSFYEYNAHNRLLSIFFSAMPRNPNNSDFEAQCKAEEEKLINPSAANDAVSSWLRRFHRKKTSKIVFANFLKSSSISLRTVLLVTCLLIFVGVGPNVLLRGRPRSTRVAWRISILLPATLQRGFAARLKDYRWDTKSTVCWYPRIAH